MTEQNIYVVIFYKAKIDENNPNRLVRTDRYAYSAGAYYSLQQACEVAIKCTKLNRMSYSENNKQCLYMPKIYGIFDKIELIPEMVGVKNIPITEEDEKRCNDSFHQYMGIHQLDFGVNKQC